MQVEHHDVIIVGAGLSGVDMAYRLQTQRPGDSYVILEARGAMGGTWDLFRYPGVRSDSDMYTLGFPFRPWRSTRAIVAGEEIRDYIADTAREFGIDRQIRFHHRVLGAEWSSERARWTIEVETAEGRSRLTCRFLYMSSGYYDYAAGYTPNLAGVGDFAGRVVHPQHWPADLDVTGKRVIVIGSGATAVTLIPALARNAAHVTMLQRSPTYIVARPAEDSFAHWARRRLPTRIADVAVRWKSILLGMLLYSYARRKPEGMKRLIMKGLREQLPENYEIERDFEPSYKPWDQRICLVPDADLFTAMRSGKAEVVTDRVDHFTSAGITLQSGRRLDADVVVTATGLVVKLFGGVAITVDGTSVDPAERVIYKGQMLDGVPNFGFAFGYTNASWTLKCDLTARWVCRMLDHMDRRGHDACTPILKDPEVVPEPMLTFTSGYIERAAKIMPKQGSAAPWRVHQNYLADLSVMRLGRIDDGVLKFS